MNGMKKPKMPKMSPDMGGMAMPKFGSRAMRPGGMKKGGMAHADEAMDKKLIRKEIARAEKMEEKSEAKGMKKGGDVSVPNLKRDMEHLGRWAEGSKKGASPEAMKNFGDWVKSTKGKMSKKMARGGGVETKGKTKGKFI